MAQKTGRNDACLCGSGGKKFKKCCMKDIRIVVSDPEWQKIRETEGKLIMGALRPWVQSVSPDLAICAWDDFWFGEKSWPESVYDGVSSQLFTPWFLFNWKPNALPKTGRSEIEEGFPIALQFLQKKGHFLSDYEKKYIREVCRTHYSFYVVTEAVPEISLTLKDIFLKSSITVKETQASCTLKPGDIIYTRILSMDDQAVCLGIMPIPIPSQFHVELLDIRETLTEENGELTQEKLAGILEESIREILFEFMDDILNPTPPQICNTDGDPVRLCTLSFSLDCTPEEACTALLPMTLDKKPDSYLAESRKNKKTGEITRIELPWLKKGNKRHGHWENTLLGDIVIERKKITVTVNSENRAKKAEKAIIKRLGDKVHFMRLKKSSIAQSMKKMSAGKQQRIPEEIPPEAQMAIQSKIADHLRQHWVSRL